MLVLIHPFPLICWDSILNRHNWKLEDRDTLCVNHVVGVQSISCVWLFETPWTVAHQALLSSTISHEDYRKYLDWTHQGSVGKQMAHLK